MWLLQGRFAEDSRQELSKVLKCGQTYTLGRKIPADIVVDSKFVSRTSCHIAVASEDTIASQVATVSDPSAFHSNVALRPRVTIRFEANKSRKTFGVLQQPDSSRRAPTSELTEVQVPADQDHPLSDGDSFALTTTISLRLVWKPIAVCFAAKIKEVAISPLRKPALQLGIHLSPAKSRWRDGYTHLCLAQIKPTESVLCALLQARPIVTIDYFNELFRRAELPRHDPASLETSFEELDFAVYQPGFDQQELSDLPDMQQKLLPQERRTYMLKGTTCVVFALPNEESELSIYKSILSVGGAHVFTHNPQAENLKTKADFAQLLMPYKNSALSYWRNSGSKARSEAPDEGLVVLVGAMHDHTPWKDACTIACTNLRIAMPAGFHAITNAVFAADVRAHLNSIPNMSDGQVEVGPAAEPATDGAAQASTEQAAEAEVTAIERVADQISPPPATSVPDQTRRVSPAAHTAEQRPTAIAEPSGSSGEASRRRLTRRTRKPAQDAGQVIAGIEEEMEQRERQLREGNTHTQAGVRYAAETSSSQLTRVERSGLTRRTGASRGNARRSDIFDAILQPGGKAAAEEGGGSNSLADDTLNGSEAAIGRAMPRSRRYRMDLDEEDRAQSESIVQSQGLEASQSKGNKRKSAPQRQASDADQIQDDDAAIRSRASKRVRTDGPVPEEIGEPGPNHAHPMDPARIVRADVTNGLAGLTNGAAPDSEPQFLQALNTQRAKGKKMDDFDVEFNRLQIARPGSQTVSGSRDQFNGPRPGKGAQQERQTQGFDTGYVDEDYEAFKQMAEEELRIHVRGNFVQVDFVPLVRQKKAVDEEPQVTPASGADVPNFKKFRPKSTAGSSSRAGARPTAARLQIALTLPESNDYGLGQSYWEDQEGASAPAAGTLSNSRGGRSSRAAGRQRIGSDDESESIQKPRAKDAPVDLGKDGLDSMESEDEGDLTTMLKQQHDSRSQRSEGKKGSTTATASTARGRKRPAALVQDSDDETMSPSSASVAASRKKRAPARGSNMLIDSDDNEDSGEGTDDDDDGNFAGFGRCTSTRRRRDPPASSKARARRSLL
ncbi:hypothetical protein EX895_006197 [Sporisorium graminicola]|uniref:FHA domain-containing protein n=1 Tax=Sporisorium graminicola TaxID=280036 RepID=A0A4U7KMR6_9BASI|nr:hypothetical protein EX895_006197 [Sporisorium graminicola]TKY85117.1 hypothetical protein EX895_006197 [Sporisorium graminicola]